MIECDSRNFEVLLDLGPDVDPRAVVADKGYDAKTNREAARKRGICPVIPCDVGLPTVWAARYLAMNGTRRLIGSFWHGSMANAMAQAIGAQQAFPDRQVISLSGDGGFTMLMGDFLTLVQRDQCGSCMDDER